MTLNIFMDFFRGFTKSVQSTAQRTAEIQFTRQRLLGRRVECSVLMGKENGVSLFSNGALLTTTIMIMMMLTAHGR